MKLACFLLFALLCFAGAAQSKKDPLEHVHALYDSGRYEPALKEVTELIETGPALPELYDLRAQIHSELKNHRQAAEDFTEAIALAPQDPIYYHHRAILFYTIQQPDLAIKDNNEALKYVKNDSLKYSIINNRGNARLMKRDFQGAYDDYMQVLRFDSTHMGVLTNLGAVLDDLGRDDEAILYLERAIRLHPDFVGGYGNLAFRHASKGRYKEAMALYNKVLELDPNEALAYNNRGFVKYKTGDLKGALQDINKSLEMYPSNSYAYKNRALVYIAQKDPEPACADLEQAAAYGFTEMYGPEVVELMAKHCTDKL